MIDGYSEVIQNIAITFHWMIASIQEMEGLPNSIVNYYLNYQVFRVYFSFLFELYLLAYLFVEW